MYTICVALRTGMQMYADVVQLVERQLPKLNVAGSSPVIRSKSYFVMVQRLPSLLTEQIGYKESGEQP